MSGTAILAVVVVAYALFAAVLDRRSITAPILFVTVGVVLGPDAVDLVSFGFEDEVTLRITESVLALLLFADAATVPLAAVESDRGLPVRLLGVGLPVTIILGTLAAWLLFPDAGFAVAALVATILAPTDAALGMAVVTNPAVPVRIRRALNVESGLNDGIATPFVTLFLAIVVAEEAQAGGAWLAEAAAEIGIALLIAAAVGLIGGRLVRAARHRGWSSRTSEQLAVLGLAIVAYAGAVALGGNGFVAAFVGGIVFGAAGGRGVHDAVGYAETTATFASFFVWTVFGSLFVGPLLARGLDVPTVVFAILSLTVVRMFPVAIALRGTRLRATTTAFMGWFGPRGLASVVFTLIAVEAIEEAGGVGTELADLATATIAMSVLVHGLSAGPLATAYASALGSDPAAAEMLDVPEPRRRRHIAGSTS
jgi:NhaP-type Na+/H+ or K+/H+ antiporter